MSETATAAATGAASVALLLAAPSPHAAVRSLTAVSGAASTTDPLAPLLSLLALAAWGLAGWLLVVLVVAAATRLTGPAGRLADAALPRIAPVAVRRLLAPLLGVTVGLGVLGAVPAAASPLSTRASSASPHREAPVASLRSLTPRLRNRAGVDPAGLDWPVSHSASGPTDLDWPVATPASSAPTHIEPVVVQAGDSLWGIAAAHLPAGASAARIAQAWPQWWSANRAAVGADPDLIHPGLSLTPPAQH